MCLQTKQGLDKKLPNIINPTGNISSVLWKYFCKPIFSNAGPEGDCIETYILPSARVNVHSKYIFFCPHKNFTVSLLHLTTKTKAHFNSICTKNK